MNINDFEQFELDLLMTVHELEVELMKMDDDTRYLFELFIESAREAIEMFYNTDQTFH